LIEERQRVGVNGQQANEQALPARLSTTATRREASTGESANLNAALPDRGLVPPIDLKPAPGNNALTRHVEDPFQASTVY
jgi:hypothetical protein